MLEFAMYMVGSLVFFGALVGAVVAFVYFAESKIND